MRLPRQTQLFALGSILHLIQNSYSRSHTHREFGVWKIKEFYKYPNHNHCLSDAGAITNKTEIEKAVSMSTRYLKMKDGKENDWCTHITPFIKGVFDMSDIIDEKCK